MNKDDLIVKQQLEIEGLKEEINNYKEVCRDARLFLVHPEQWSEKSALFPSVAMRGIVGALRAIDGM